MSTQPDARLWATPTRPVVAGALALMTFIAIESFAITTVLPVVADDLGATSWYSFAFAATITTALVGMVVGGAWADRSGITTPLVCGGLLFLTGIGLCVIAQDMTSFVLGRLLQGLGGGIDSVLVYVIIARHIPQDLQARMFGLLAAAWLLPAMAGPLAAGALTDLVSWRVVFAAVLAGSAAALVTLGVATRAPRTTQAVADERIPVLGRRARLAVVAAACLILIHLGGPQPLPASLAVVGLGLIGLAATASRLLPAGTLRARPGIPALVALRGMLGAAVAATDVYLPLYLQHERDYSPTASGLVVAIGALGWAAGAWIQGRAVNHPRDDGHVIRRATALVLCGPLAALAFIIGAVPVLVAVVGCILMGTGMGLAYPRISSAVLTRSSTDEHGHHSSALQAAESMSTSAFLAVTALALTAFAGVTGYLTVYSLAAALVATAILST